MSSDAAFLVRCLTCDKLHEPETPLEHRSICVECMPPLEHDPAWVAGFEVRVRRPNEPEFVTGRRSRVRSAA